MIVLDAIGLARFDADGSLDTTFANSGTAVTNFGGDESPHAVALGPDGEIVVLADASFDVNSSFLVRYQGGDIPYHGPISHSYLGLRVIGTDAADQIDIQNSLGMNIIKVNGEVFEESDPVATVHAGGGDDVITISGQNHSLIDGDDGDDSIVATGGKLRLYGGTGDDTLSAHGTRESIFGEDGRAPRRRRVSHDSDVPGACRIAYDRMGRGGRGCRIRHYSLQGQKL